MKVTVVPVGTVSADDASESVGGLLPENAPKFTVKSTYFGVVLLTASVVMWMPLSKSENVRPIEIGESSLPYGEPGVVSMSWMLLPLPLGKFHPRMSPLSAHGRVVLPV